MLIPHLRKIISFLLLILSFQTLPLFCAESMVARNAQSEEETGAKVQSYSDLLKAVRELQVATARRVELAVAAEKLREAWETGNLIQRHILLNQNNADYGKVVIRRLGKDLGMEGIDLYRRCQFAKLYPVMPITLTYSHYCALITVRDVGERGKIEKEAIEKNWTKRKLIQEIRRRKLSVAAIRDELLTPQKGVPGTYRVVNMGGKLQLDLGFSNYLSLSAAQAKGLKEGDIVEALPRLATVPHPRGAEKVVPGNAGGWGEPVFKKSNRTAADLYTYQAEVLEVTDGDTLWALVDLGFGMTTKQHLRLRGIDTPELPSAEGKEAKEFVQAELKNIQRIVISSMRSDKYDRYLADVFYASPRAGRDSEKENGDGTDVFLNNELLENELAVHA